MLMTPKQQQMVLEIARDSVRAAVNKWNVASPVCDDGALNAKCGCFVTLKKFGKLRGCIGQFTSGKPLAKLVSEMAVAATIDDPRFLSDPITPEELDQLNIEISILSPLKKTENPLSLRLGIDGIYIAKGHKSGCFLPQVAIETGWTEEQFLTNCCLQKAHLPPDAWQEPDTEVYFFTAECFSDNYSDI